jgi:hypothetical protein
MNHGTDDDEVAGSERPERLVNFQRKMDKLQGRFGEALKRLSKPPSGAPVTSSTHTSEVQREGQVSVSHTLLLLLWKDAS